MKKFTADFETNVSEEDCRVWAYALCEIGNVENFIYGNSIEDFINFCADKKENYKLWFHNLKFDGEYILSYILNKGYKFVKDKKDARSKTFTCLISDTGQFYSLEIYFEKNKNHTNKVSIYDSMKLINMGVDKIAEDFDLPIRKLKLDYKTIRKKGHKLTKHEIDYIKNDVEIMSRALEIFFQDGNTKMTIGSNALENYKKTIHFDNYFHKITYETDQEIRDSYKGGWVYLNPIYENQKMNDGLVIDKNSMYPSMMRYEYLPFGSPEFFSGKYDDDLLYPLYIQTLSCSFQLKKGKLPTLQMKNNLSFMPNEYVETTNEEIVTLTLTNIDLELFFDHYDVENIMYHSGYKFHKMKGLFNKYIDYWTNKKIESKKNKNKAMYQISKLFLNSLYGKFGTNPNVRSKFPYLDEEGIVKYKLMDPEIRDSIYLPVASFITSLARNDIIRSAQKIRDYSLEKYGFDAFIYADTDSLHVHGLKEEDIYNLFEIDSYKLGAWDLENNFKTGIFIRQKCYIEEGYDGEIKTTIAGLPKKLGSYITIDNFKKGFTVLASDKTKEHKLRFKHVKGGVLLVDTDFTIK